MKTVLQVLEAQWLDNSVVQFFRLKLISVQTYLKRLLSGASACRSRAYAEPRWNASKVRCLGGILIKCLNHFSWLLLTPKSSGSTPGSLWMSVLLTLFLTKPSHSSEEPLRRNLMLNCHQPGRGISAVSLTFVTSASFHNSAFLHKLSKRGVSKRSKG